MDELMVALFRGKRYGMQAKSNTLQQLLTHVGSIELANCLEIKTIQTKSFNPYYMISFNKSGQKLDMFDNNICSYIVN